MSDRALRLGDEGYLPPAFYMASDEAPAAACGERHNDTPFSYECTRADGHDGDHAAHGGGDEMFHRWSREQEAA